MFERLGYVKIWREHLGNQYIRCLYLVLLLYMYEINVIDFDTKWIKIAKSIYFVSI